MGHRTLKVAVFLIAALASSLTEAGAVAIFSYSPNTDVNYPYNYTYSYAITNTDGSTIGSSVTNWNRNNSWGSNTVSGWDYVGTVNGASAVYLSNGWVITAAHINSNDQQTYTLNGTPYTILDGSYTQVGSTDLMMFQLDTSPTLPSLVISQSSPTAGKEIALIGYGNQIKSWGKNTTISTTYNAVLTGASAPYINGVQTTVTSSDFLVSGGQGTSEAISGDSGGAGFIYNSTSHKWELAGIMELELVDNPNGWIYTGLIDLSQYRTDINAIMAAGAAPEPGTYALLIVGGATLLAVRHKKMALRRKPSTAPA